MSARLSLIAIPLLVAGCSRGRVELSSLDFKSIDPPAPSATSVRLQECYWWAEDDGDVRVAMRYVKNPPLFPKFRLEFNMSLVLEQPPRGQARNYDLNRQTMRAQVSMGPWQTRFTSVVGIAALYRESGDRFRGSVRMQAARVAARLLGGWGKPTRYLLQSSFTATHNPDRGREILEMTESDGWVRKLTPRKPPVPEEDQPRPANLPGATTPKKP